MARDGGESSIDGRIMGPVSPDWLAPDRKRSVCVFIGTERPGVVSHVPGVAVRPVLDPRRWLRAEHRARRSKYTPC